MRKAVTLVAGAVAASALMTSIGNGVASADSVPDITGQKYSDAQATLSSGGFIPVVSTTVGDRDSWSDCVVTNAVERTVQPPENSGGSSTNDVLVSLNCDAPVASAKTPGNSAASPAGRAALAEKKAQAAQASATPAAAG
jgi:hypothetical protein